MSKRMIADTVSTFELSFDEILTSQKRLEDFNMYMYFTSEIMKAEEIEEQRKKEEELKTITPLTAGNDYFEYELWKEHVVHEYLNRDLKRK